jgi:hypothetical protein
MLVEVYFSDSQYVSVFSAWHGRVLVLEPSGLGVGRLAVSQA